MYMYVKYKLYVLFDMSFVMNAGAFVLWLVDMDKAKQDMLATVSRRRYVFHDHDNENIEMQKLQTHDDAM